MLYGLARGGHLSRSLAHVARRTHTPVRATLLVGAAILACVLSLELVPLARLTSYVALVIFAIVNVALASLRWQDQRAAGRPSSLAWRPLCGLLLVLALLFAEILRAA